MLELFVEKYFLGSLPLEVMIDVCLPWERAAKLIG